MLRLKQVAGQNDSANSLHCPVSRKIISLIGCTSLLAESGIPRTQPGGDNSGDGHTTSRSDGPSTATTPSTPRTDLLVVLGRAQCARPPGARPSCRLAVKPERLPVGGEPPSRICGLVTGGPSGPDRRKPDRSPAGGESPARICWSVSGGHSAPDRREPDRSPAGGKTARPDSRSLPGGHSGPDRWGATSCRAGGEPPSRVCWLASGGRSVPDRREPDRLPAGGEPPALRPASAGHYQAGTVCLFAGRAPTRRAGGWAPGRTLPGTVRRALCA
jgi:hypothetical protein